MTYYSAKIRPKRETEILSIGNVGEGHKTFAERYVSFKDLLKYPKLYSENFSFRTDDYAVVLVQNQKGLEVLLLEQSTKAAWPHYVSHPSQIQEELPAPPQYYLLNQLAQQAKARLEHVDMIGVFRPPSGEEVKAALYVIKNGVDFAAMLQDPTFAAAYSNIYCVPIKPIFNPENHTTIIGHAPGKLENKYEVPAIEGLLADEHVYGITAIVLKAVAERYNTLEVLQEAVNRENNPTIIDPRSKATCALYK